MKELNQIQVIDENLDEIKNDELVEYAGEFEIVGKLSIGDQIRVTHIRFRKITEIETYTNATDQDYESKDATFNGYIYKLNTPQFNLVKRSQYGNSCNFKQKYFGYRGKKC